MKKVYLDANILLEILFRRARYGKVVELLGSMEEVQFCVSVLSIDLVMYFVEIEKQPKDKAWEFLEKYEKLDMKLHDIEWAHDNDRGDFEDALQVGCARRHKCAQFITLDQSVERRYGRFISVQTIR
jgi:predicted nucleic acid-binding protein